MSVTLEGVGHRFPTQPWLFRGLDLQLEPGRIYGVVGPSGSGKSTLLSILAGWLTPTAGRVITATSGRTGWVFQNPHGSPRRSAGDHVALPLLARGWEPAAADAEAQDLLARFGLRGIGDRPFAALSGGEGQRLMLARGIAARPALLLVDEPTAQLDQRTAATVNDAIANCVADSVVVVVATHDPRTREACTDVVDLAGYSE